MHLKLHNPIDINIHIFVFTLTSLPALLIHFRGVSSKLLLIVRWVVKFPTWLYKTILILSIKSMCFKEIIYLMSCELTRHGAYKSHSSYSWNIKWQKCARMGLNAFLIEWIIGTHCNWKNQNPGSRFSIFLCSEFSSYWDPCPPIFHGYYFFYRYCGGSILLCGK